MHIEGFDRLFVEEIDDFLPDDALGVVDLAQIEDVPLHQTVSDTAPLDD